MIAAAGDVPFDSPMLAWPQKPLGEVATVIAGQSPPSSTYNQHGDGLPFFQGKAEFGRDYPAPSKWCASPTKVAAEGDILISVRAPVGPTNFSPFACGIGRGLAAIRVSSELDRRWLRYWLGFSQARLVEKATGTTFEAITGEVLRAHVCPVPQLALQRRIVARIDELFSELDDGEVELARARDDLETYRKTLLRAAVTGELTAAWRKSNPTNESAADVVARIADRRVGGQSRRTRGSTGAPVMAKSNSSELPGGWVWTTLPSLGEFGRGKSRHRPRNDPRLYGGPYPFVQTGIVSASRGRITSYEQTYTELGLAQSKLWEAGTLCITIAANIAKTGVLTFDACFPDSVVGLSCGEGIIPAYVELVVRSLQAGLERDAPATAQKNINLDTFVTLPIPLPPSAEQQAIVDAFNEAEAAADLATRNDLDHGIAALRQSILAAAFRGELAQ
jgi:type I restriction enzyme S subunit